MSQVYREIDKHGPELAVRLSQPLLHFWALARDLFGGDAEKVLLTLVVGLRTHALPLAAHTARMETWGETATPSSPGVNLTSLVAATGIPLNVVRSKLGELAAAGFLVQAGDDYRSTAEGYAAVAHVREALERLALRNYDDVRRLVDTPGDGPAEPRSWPTCGPSAAPDA